MVEVKKCSKCLIVKPIIDFTKDKKTKDGHSYYCKECFNIYQNKRNEKLSIKKEVKEGFKKCNKCGRELPMTSEYFIRNSNTKSGFKYCCRECDGSKFKIENKGFKICTICNKELPSTLEFFRKQSNVKCGLRSNCRQCERIIHREQEKTRIKRADVKIKIKILNKNNYEKNKEEIKQKSREYYYKNREKEIIRMKKYRNENKEKIEYISNKWRKEHMELYRTYGQRREAKKKDLPHTLTIKQWQQIKLKFNNKCAYCGEEKPLEQEHFIPINKGGEYTSNNIITACKSCNCSKQDSDFFKWYRKQDFYSKQREDFILKYLGYKKEVQQLRMI